jgi:hypothetical protein
MKLKNNARRLMNAGALARVVTLIVVAGLPGLVCGQEASDLDKLKSTLESLQQTIQEQNQKISDLEKGQKAAAPAMPAPAIAGTGGV